MLAIWKWRPCSGSQDPLLGLTRVRLAQLRRDGALIAAGLLGPCAARPLQQPGAKPGFGGCDALPFCGGLIRSRSSSRHHRATPVTPSRTFKGEELLAVIPGAARSWWRPALNRGDHG